MPKFEDKPADKWNDLFKSLLEDPHLEITTLTAKENATFIAADSILVD
jgi:hypothetical protein